MCKTRHRELVYYAQLARCIPRSSWVVCAKRIDKSRNESETEKGDAPEDQTRDASARRHVSQFPSTQRKAQVLTNTNLNRRPTVLGA
jgi:hypothetical protein